MNGTLRRRTSTPKGSAGAAGCTTKGEHKSSGKLPAHIHPTPARPVSLDMMVVLDRHSKLDPYLSDERSMADANGILSYRQFPNSSDAAETSGALPPQGELLNWDWRTTGIPHADEALDGAGETHGAYLQKPITASPFPLQHRHTNLNPAIQAIFHRCMQHTQARPR